MGLLTLAGEGEELVNPFVWAGKGAEALGVPKPLNRAEQTLTGGGGIPKAAGHALETAITQPGKLPGALAKIPQEATKGIVGDAAAGISEAFSGIVGEYGLRLLEVLAGAGLIAFGLVHLAKINTPSSAGGTVRSVAKAASTVAK